MKKIVLIRHAKSSWDNPWLNDHDRPLAERGIKAAPIMGKGLLKRGIKPDLILSSSAERAVTTAKLIVEAMEASPEIIEIEPNLYHASPSVMMKYIHMQKDSKETIFLVGHNPGLNDLIEFLGEYIDNLPTAGIFCFNLLVDSWAEMKAKTVKKDFWDYPKNKKRS